MSTELNESTELDENNKIGDKVKVAFGGMWHDATITDGPHPKSGHIEAKFKYKKKLFKSRFNPNTEVKNESTISHIDAIVEGDTTMNTINEGYHLVKSKDEEHDISDEWHDDDEPDSGPKKAYERDYKVVHNKTGKHVATLHTHGNDYFGGSDYSDLTLHHASGTDTKVAGPQHTAEHPDKAINRHFKKPTKKIKETLASHGINESTNILHLIESIDECGSLTPSIEATTMTDTYLDNELNEDIVVGKTYTIPKYSARDNRRVPTEVKVTSHDIANDIIHFTHGHGERGHLGKKLFKSRMIESTVSLIDAIVEGDTIASAQLFNEALRSRIDEKVAVKKKEVAAKIDNSKTFHTAAKHKSHHVRMQVAKHPNTPHDVLNQLVNDKDVRVATAALANPKTGTIEVEEKDKKSPIKGLINHIKKYKEED